MYSASKHPIAMNLDISGFNDTSLGNIHPVEPAIDIVHDAIRKITSSNVNSLDKRELVDFVTLLLQNVEEKLEDQRDLQKPRESEAAFSTPNFQDRLSKANTLATTGQKGVDGDGGVSGKKRPPQSVVKVYMKNQLDLNEAELEQYEEMINQVIRDYENEKLEKEEALETCSSLGERLRQAHEDNSGLRQQLQQLTLSHEDKENQLVNQLHDYSNQLQAKEQSWHQALRDQQVCMCVL